MPEEEKQAIKTALFGAIDAGTMKIDYNQEDEDEDEKSLRHKMVPTFAFSTYLEKLNFASFMLHMKTTSKFRY